MGLATDGASIESGLERLGLFSDPPTEAERRAWNRRMMALAGAREPLAARWRAALGPQTAGLGRLVWELRLDARPFYPRLWLTGLSAPTDADHFGPLRWWRRYRARSRLLGMARAVVEALAADGVIAAAMPRVQEGQGGRLGVTLPDAPHLDQVRFVEALAQIFRPLEAPRYLLLRQGRYYAVPPRLGSHKPKAMAFAERWRRWVGKADLIFTQNRAGRLHLLKAQEQALAEYLDYRLDTRTRWRG